MHAFILPIHRVLAPSFEDGNGCALKKRQVRDRSGVRGSKMQEALVRRSWCDAISSVVDFRDFVEVAVKRAHFRVFVVAPKDRRDDRVIGQVFAVAVPVVDLQGFAVVRCGPRGGRVQQRHVEQANRARWSVDIGDAPAVELRVIVGEHGFVDGLGR